MFNKVLALVLAAGLLVVWTAADVAVVRWSMPALADDDDDDGDDDDDDDRRRPRTPRPVPLRERPEVLATGLSAADLDRLLTQGFTLVRTQQITLLGTTLARLRAPLHLARRQALDMARRLVPNASVSSNDLYRRLLHAPTDQAAAAAASTAKRSSSPAGRWPRAAARSML